MFVLRSRSIIIISCLACLSILFSLSQGSMTVSLSQVGINEQSHLIIFKVRLPRTFTAFTSGGLLALAGTLMQLLIQNPLADPYVLGISGGAACATLLLMLLGISNDWLIVGAYLGSLLTVAFILFLAKKHRWQTHPLLLSGIALACGFSALISFMLLISPETTLHSMLFWLTGDLNAAYFPWLGLSILSFGLIVCLALARGLNILSRGDKEAQALGLAYQKYRLIL
ncbi:MAG: iron ABC transporter permease, partial [Gammaproteobacteria bacterium]|nr:iron ABC transporter permease [Gammaproteobacteria bacterium]